MTAETRQRCRTIEPSGYQCSSAALSGHEQCFVHGRDHRRRLSLQSSPAPIEIPLLDNPAAIQIVTSDICRALLAGTIDHATVRLLLAALRVASQTLPRPVAIKASSKKGKDLTEQRQPVTEIVTTPEGEELAPPTAWNLPEEKKERPWSLSEYLYRSMHPESAAEPLPKEGYIDPGQSSTITSGDYRAVHNASEPSAPPATETEYSSAHPKMTGDAVAGEADRGRKPQPGIIKELSAIAADHRIPVSSWRRKWLTLTG